MLAECHQLLVVTTHAWEAVQGNLQLYERVNDHSAWIAVEVSIPVVVGKKGLAWGKGLHPLMTQMLPLKKEGDGKSPAGIFSLGSAFGFASRHEMGHLKIDYLQLHADTEAIDDPLSHYYNHIVSSKDMIPDWQSSEQMRKEPLYSIGLVVNHNFPNPQAGAGSAIFMHIWRQAHAGTAGCTAMSQENLAGLLSWLDKNKHPILVQLPICKYQKLQKIWNLPELKRLSTN